MEATRIVHTPLALALVLLGCTAAHGGPAQEETTPDRGAHDIVHEGPYEHAGSGAVFPAKVGALERGRLHAYDGAERDVSAAYGLEDRMLITAYVYPAGRAQSGRLPSHFLRVIGEMEQAAPRIELLERRLAPLEGPPEGIAGFEARFRTGDGVKLDRVQVFQCGHWFLKLRVTHFSGYTELMEQNLAELRERISCHGIAARNPAGEIKQVQLDQALSDGDAARWVAYGVGRITWMQTTMTPAQRAYGVPDQDYRFHHFALTQALELHRGMTDSKSPTFDALAKIEAAGMLDEFIWLTYMPSLDPPEDLGLELQAFEAWFAQHVGELQFPRALVAEPE